MKPVMILTAATVLCCAAVTPARPEPATAPTGSASPAAPDLNRIRSLVAMGRSKEALPLAESAAQAAPQNAAAQDLLGQVLLPLGKLDEAVKALTAATTLDPKNAAALTHLGDAYLLRYETGLADFVKKHQNDMLGQIHSDVPTVQSGGPDQPAQLLDDVLINDRSSAQMTPREWDQLSRMAKEARTAYTAALALQPNDKKALQGKGLAQLILGEWKDTVAAWEVSGAPVFDSFLYEIARNVNDAHGMGGEAIRMWELATEADPNNAWAYWYLRDLYDEHRHSDWRYGYYDAMRMLFSDRIEDAGDARKYSPKDARKNLEAITAAHPDYALGWRGLGMTLVRLKDTRGAAAAFEKAAALNPNDWYSFTQAGIIQLNDKDNAAAQKSLAAAAKAHPDSALIWHALGTAAERNNDLDSAVSFYERAAELAPGWSEAHWSLGALLLDRRQGAEALPHLERYLELEPKAKNAEDVRKAIAQVKEILAKSAGG